jgi:hypothetical protein
VYPKNLFFRTPSLSVHYSMHISETPQEKKTAIRPQDKWIFASESDVDHVSWSSYRHIVSNQPGFSKKEARFRVLEVLDGFTEFKSICVFRFLRHVWRYVLITGFFAEY